MRQINKYLLDAEVGVQILRLPVGFRIVHLALQGAVPWPHVWVEENNTQPIIEIEVLTVRTGDVIEDADWGFIGSYMMAEGRIVHHVYARLGAA